MSIDNATPEEWDRLKHTTSLSVVDGRLEIQWRGKYFAIDADRYPELRDFVQAIQTDHLTQYAKYRLEGCPSCE